MDAAISPPDDRLSLPSDDPVAPVDRALDRLETEHSELEAECRALERFADRIRDLAPAEAVDAGAGVPSLSAPIDSTDAMGRVRDCYRETVMDVPHYERAYGEPLAANLAAELGPELATAVCSEGGVPFTAGFRSALVEATEEAAARRETFLGTLETERESLRHARRALADVGATIESGPTEAATREELIDRLDGVTKKRQRLLHGRTLPVHVEAHGLCTYLYAELRFTYPVLGVAAAMRAQLEDADPVAATAD